MGMHDLEKIFKECMDEMKAVDIPIQDGRIAGAEAGDTDDCLGLCCGDVDNNFTIIIRTDLLSDICPLKELKEIIIHELIHTCKRCGIHGKTWRKYAQIMNNAYGYSLLEGKDDNSIFHSEKPVLHKYVCPKCGIPFGSRSEEEYDCRCAFCNGWMEIVF